MKVFTFYLTDFTSVDIPTNTIWSGTSYLYSKLYDQSAWK